MDFPNFFFIFLVKNSRFANMKKLFHFMHLKIWTKVPTSRKYSLHVWVQVQCKAATAFTQSESRRVEARVGSGSQLRNAPRNARRPGQSDRRGIENLCFQTTTVAISGFLVSLKVMYGRVKKQKGDLE